MSIEKKPLSTKELERLTDKARKVPDGEIIILLRFTGMHPSVLVDSKYNLREETDPQNRAVIVWDRPKKKGKLAHTIIKKSDNIGFDVNKFVKSFQRRKRKRSRQYIHGLVKEVGDKVGLQEKNISPMTLRHSVCVELLNRGVPEITVMQILNVSPRTMKAYAKYTDGSKVDILESIGW